MNRTSRAPSGFAFEGRAAGRTGRGSRTFPQREYHGGGRGASGRKVYVDTPFGRKVAGVLVTDAGRTAFRRLVQTDRHMVRVPEASWAFDVEVLEKVEAAGATEVEVVDECGREWRSPLAYILERGEPLDRGHGKQVALPLRLWSFLPADSAARQLALFGAAAP